MSAQQEAQRAPAARSLAALAERTNGLYSLPGVAMEVLELTKDPEVDAQKLKVCIERDAALTAKLLRVVNSSLFGLSREVTDLGQAVAILGAKPLKLLVLGFSLPDALFSGLAQEALASYWHATLCKAVAARVIGDRYYRGRGDEGLIVGLLQDVGLLIMLQQLQHPFINFVTKANEAGVDLLAAERKSLGFDHTQLTRTVLDRWNLPESIVCSVEADPEDHAEFSTKAETLHEIVQAAGLLARVLIDKRADSLQELLKSKAFRNESFERIRELVVDLRDQVKQLADVLNVSCSGEFSYEQILMDAQAQMATCGEEVLLDLVRTREETLTAEFDSQELWSAFSGPRKVPATAAAVDTTTKPAPGKPSSVAPQPPGVLTLSDELRLALASAISASRQERSATSLILASLDHRDAFALGHIPNLADKIEQAFRKAAKTMGHDCLAFVALSDFEFAFVVPHCERRAAVQEAARILAEARKSLFATVGASAVNVQLASGLAAVALPHKFFEGRELFDAASRCLSAAQQAGADAVKSIEIY